MFLHVVMVTFLTKCGFGAIPFQYSFEQYPALSDCLLKILEDEIRTKNIVFLKEEVQEYKPVESLLKLNWDRIIVSSYNVSSVSGLFLFLPNINTTISYEKIMRLKHNDYNSKYIICTDNTRNILNLFEVAWENQVIDVIALLPSKITGRISVYTYFPFGPFGCSTTDPVRINIYEPIENSFELNETVFSKAKKLNNLYKCPVRITVSEKPAEFIANDNTNSYNGVSLTLFSFLQQFMNFTPQIILIDHEANTYAAAYYNFTSAVVLSIVNGHADIGVGRFSQLVDYHNDIESPAQTSMDCFTWAVPMKAGTRPSVWTTSIYEFDYLMWILIILSMILAIYVLKFLNKLPVFLNEKDGLAIFAIMLNISTKMNLKTHSLKVFIACWILYCFVITAAYCASLGSLVTVPPDSSDIENSMQLLNKDFILTGDPKMYHILSASSETSPLLKKILEKFVILLPDEFKKIIYKIYTKRNIAVFYTSNKLIEEENRVISTLRCGKMVHIVPKCLITSHTSPLIMKKGSVLMEPVKMIVVRLWESGILHNWDEKGDSIRPNVTKTAYKFTISQLRGALIVTITGYIISSIAFAYELLSPRFVKKKTKSVKMTKVERKLQFLP
nr:uncharacterized protein LOC106692762 [Halyomorpha halys]